MRWPSSYDAYINDIDFRHRLHKTLPIIKSLERVRGSRSYTDIDTFNKQLEPLLTDHRIPPLIESSDLHVLIDELPDDQNTLMSHYKLARGTI